MSFVTILKAPDGSVAYTRPAGRRILVDLQSDNDDKPDLGFFTVPRHQQRSNETTDEWVARVRWEVLTSLAMTFDPLPDNADAPRFSPPGNPSMEWLAAHRGQMRSRDILAILNASCGLFAEADQDWLARAYREAKAGWQADPENCAHFLAMERVADIPASAIPTGEMERKYRDCWTWTTDKPEIDIDMAKARTKRAAELRAVRNGRLDRLDKDEMAAAEKPDALRKVRERKQKLRDAPEIFEPQLRKAKTLAELEAVTLPE